LYFPTKVGVDLASDTLILIETLFLRVVVSNGAFWQ
jgi:hypothetical protein